MNRVIITNACINLVSNADAQKWVDAIARQVACDFAPIWSQSAILHYIGDSATEKPEPDDGAIRLVSQSSEEGALGTHWLSGLQSVGEVGVQTCISDGTTPSSCLSHEVLEMILDPEAVHCFQVKSLFLMLEACDRCEGSDPDYKIDGIALENFSTPRAFLDDAPGPWDFRKKCSSNVVLPAGYQLQVDLGSGQWSQITGERARASKQGAAPSSRRASRMRRAGADPTSLVIVPA